MKQIYLKCSNYFNENSKLGAYSNQCYLKANLSNTENIIDLHDQFSFDRVLKNLQPSRFNSSSFFFFVFSMEGAFS